MKFVFRIFFALMSLCLINTAQARITRVWSVAEYDALVKKGCPMVVKFFADWCNACQVITTEFSNISQNPEFSHINFVDINVDSVPKLADRERVESVPTFLFVHKKKRKGKVVGIADPDKFEKYMTKKIKAKLPKKRRIPGMDTIWAKTQELFAKTLKTLWGFSSSVLNFFSDVFWT